MRYNEDVVFVCEGVCDIIHRIYEKVTRAIYVWALLNQVDAF